MFEAMIPLVYQMIYCLRFKLKAQASLSETMDPVSACLPMQRQVLVRGC